MRRTLCAVAFALAASAPAWGQSATGVGVGISGSSSTSASSATSFGGGQGGTGGNANSLAGGGQSNLTINNNGQATGPDGVVRSRTEQIIEQRGGTTSLNRQTGGLRNVPATFAPGLTAAGLETCLGSISGGGSFMGGGVSFGTTVPDRGCSARLDARTLWSMGLKKAAVARLCLTSEIQQSMPEVCSEYLPVQAQSGVYAPAPAVAAARLEPVEYNGGRVQVTERRTGQVRWCDRYANGRCLQWSR
jgi:hypothetical protein